MRISEPLLTPPLLADVATPVITPQGTGGVETWTYVLVGIDANGKRTAATNVGSTAVGNAALDGTDFNRITWTDITDMVSYELFRTVSGGTPASLGLIGTALQGVQTFDDTGLVGDASTANAVNETGDGAETLLFGTRGDFSVILGAVGTATYQIQISADKVSWHDEGSALTADGVLDVASRAMYVRSQCTAFTSGTPAGFMVGDGS